MVEDSALVANAIEELLRYESPSPVQARYVTNRDDRHFSDGESFDIHRTIDHHLAFGYGIHFCLGSALARLEGRLAVDEVLPRVPSWEVDWDNTVQARTATVRGLGEASGHHILSRVSAGTERGCTFHENPVMRTAVIGASSGLGRSIATGLGQRGATVALMARREDRLVDAAKEAGPGALAIVCDVTDEASCRAAIDQAVSELGGLDALVYATGVGPLGRLVDASADTWRHTFDTNVIGAALVTAAAIPHLTASRGVAAYLSSVSASVTPPWPGLGVYATSKAALETMVEAWRNEHPAVSFTRVVVGDCAGGEGPSATEFASGWDWDLAAELLPIWQARNYLAGSIMDVDELVRVVDTVLRCGASAHIPSVAVTPRPPI